MNAGTGIDQRRKRGLLSMDAVISETHDRQNKGSAWLRWRRWLVHADAAENAEQTPALASRATMAARAA